MLKHSSKIHYNTISALTKTHAVLRDQFLHRLLLTGFSFGKRHNLVHDSKILEEL